MTITTSDLEALLVAKVEAKAAWDTAQMAANKLTSTDQYSERVSRDLEAKRMIKAYCAIETAYDEALGQYIAQERERRTNASA